MQLEEYKNRKRQMEAEILAAAQAAVDSFKADTGLSPSSVEIVMGETTSLNSINREYKPAFVNSDVEI